MCFEAKDISGIIGKTGMGSEALGMYKCQCPDFAGCAVVILENVAVCRKYMEMFGNDGIFYLLFALK